MHRSRTLAALLALALSLQLMLAGKGERCVGQAFDDERMGMTMRTSAMRDMEMAVRHGPRALVGDRELGSTSAPDQQPNGAPCDRAPAITTCQVFASCSAGFVVAAADPIIQHVAPTSPRVTTTASLSSRTIAPELPPPRA